MIMPLLTIAFIFAVLSVVVIFQAVALSRIFNSWAWMLLTAAFTISGVRHIWVLFHHASQMLSGVPIPSPEWLSSALSFAAFCCVIIGFDRMRRDLESLGIRVEVLRKRGGLNLET